MSIELMLNAVNLSFITFSSYLNSVDGQMFVFLVLTVAAAEVVVGLAIIVSIFRTRRNINVDDMNILRG
jgi:NADH-quinone oxidoreductase subunit K